VLLTGNPLEDIEALATVVLGFKEGRIVYHAGIDPPTLLRTHECVITLAVIDRTVRTLWGSPGGGECQLDTLAFGIFCKLMKAQLFIASRELLKK
jgi:hypothetical protein